MLTKELKIPILFIHILKKFVSRTLKQMKWSESCKRETKKGNLRFKSFRQKYLDSVVYLATQFMLYLGATKGHGEHFSYVKEYFICLL